MKYSKDEFRTLRSIDAKADKQFKKDKAELLRSLAASNLDWAWGSRTKAEYEPRNLRKGYEYQ